QAKCCAHLSFSRNECEIEVRYQRSSRPQGAEALAQRARPRGVEAEHPRYGCIKTANRIQISPPRPPPTKHEVWVKSLDILRKQTSINLLARPHATPRRH